MEKKTLEKTSAAQVGKTEGEGPQRQTNAEIGSITRGSDTAGHFTEAHQTTSTLPAKSVSSEFLEKLAEVRDAEKQLTRVLPILALAAKSKDLKSLLELHLAETKGHLASLDAIADSLGTELPQRSCPALKKSIGHAEKELLKVALDGNERDRVIIAAGLEAEQFEIDSYTPLCQTAEKNDWAHEFAILTSILNQEKLAKELLIGVREGKEPLVRLVEKASLAQIKGQQS